jgi:homoserine O-acetyltransferase
MSFKNNSAIQEPVNGFFQFTNSFLLESGKSIQNPCFQYQTWGQLAEDKSNVIWVCHALTGNHQVHDWWSGVVGSGLPFDPAVHFIICVNVLGGCAGSTGPLSLNESIGCPYFNDFPSLTIRDIVNGLKCVHDHLGIAKIKCLIGASFGGQQALEWAIQEEKHFDSVILIACNAQHSAYGIAWNAAQRLCISADHTFIQNRLDGGRNGLIAARSVALLSYRSYQGYHETQKEQSDLLPPVFKAESYQQYQGEKLANRFNAYSYWILSQAMDSHNIARNRMDQKTLLRQLKLPVLVVGIDTDLLFPFVEQEFLAAHIPNSRLVKIHSHFGHDGFLVEYLQLRKHILEFQQVTTK